MAETKKCPYCGEEILATAKKCKHCGEWLDKSAKPSGVASAKVHQTSKATASTISSEPKPKKQEFTKSEVAAGCAVGGGAFLVYWGVIIGVILFVLHISVPSRERMINCVLEDAVSEVQNQADNVSSILGEDANLLTNLLANTDVAKQSIKETVIEYNHVEVDEGAFWTNAYLHNANTGRKGKLVGFGILGIAIPFVLWDDLQMLGTSKDGSSSTVSETVGDLVNEVEEIIEDTESDEDYDISDDEE